MVAGLEDVTSGEIRIGDRVVNDIEPPDRDIAMVFQNYALYPHMSVEDNMSFPLRMQRVSRGDVRARVREVAELLPSSRFARIHRSHLVNLGKVAAVRRAGPDRLRLVLDDEGRTELDVARRQTRALRERLRL